MRSILIAPSILAADFSRLADEVHRVEDAGADWIHCDIMDGHFVDNISFGSGIVTTVHKLTTLPLDIHLMIQHPDHYLPRFIDAGANSITVHVEPESKHDVAKTLEQIRGGGCRAGLTLNPATPFAQLEPYLAQLDLLLIMTCTQVLVANHFAQIKWKKCAVLAIGRRKTIPHWISKWTAELIQRRHGCRLKTEPISS